MDIVTHPDGWRTVEPKPGADELKAFYAAEYFQNSHGTYVEAYTPREIEHRRLLANLLLFGVDEAREQGAGHLLEIGCGEGWFLAAAKTAGWTIRGVDFSDDGLRRHHPELLSSAEFGDAFELLDGMIVDGTKADLCVTEHVLEHVIDPEGLLARLPRLLKPGGVVAITVPNDFSALQQHFRDEGVIDRDFWVAPPQHLSYFNTGTLPRLMTRMGLAVKTAFSSFPIDWFLAHPGSNYVMDPKAGKDAHRARLAVDLILSRHGMDSYYSLARALFACGAGRSITVIAGVA